MCNAWTVQTINKAKYGFDGLKKGTIFTNKSAITRKQSF